MTKPAHKATVSLKVSEVKALLRAWGWTRTGEGRNHAKWKKGDVTIMVRDGSGSSSVTYEPLNQAAKVEGLTFDKWKEGPPEPVKPKREQLSELDIEFFLSHNFIELKHPDDKEKFRRIRRIMDKEGTLDEYNKLKDKGFKVKAKQELPKPDDSGYIKLEEALALRGLELYTKDGKPSELSHTAAEVIAVLAQEENNTISSESGQATGLLHKKMPSANRTVKPIRTTAVSSQLKDWEEAGLVWREVKGKRTNKIGLCMPVGLTTKQREEYVHGYVPPAKRDEQQSSGPRTAQTPTPAPTAQDTPATPVGASRRAMPPGRTDDGTHADVTEAVRLLTERRDELIEQAEALSAAIIILEGE